MINIETIDKLEKTLKYLKKKNVDGVSIVKDLTIVFIGNTKKSYKIIESLQFDFNLNVKKLMY